MNKSTYAFLATGISAANLLASTSTGNIKWNVMVLMTDMQSVHYLGCDHQSRENILTPNLDKLGKDGLIFSKAYDAYPVSAPTRASLLTGVYPFKHGQNGNDVLLTEAGPQGKSPSLAHVFRDNGYNTAMWGKQHSNMEALESLPNGSYMGKNVFHGWNFRRLDGGTDLIMNSMATQNEKDMAVANYQRDASESAQFITELHARYPAEQGTAQPQWEKDLLNKYPNITLEANTIDPYGYNDATNTFESLDYLETLAGKRNDSKFGLDRAKPFFLFLSLHKPHYNWVAPLIQDGIEWWYMYSARPEDDNKTYLRNGIPTLRIIPNPIIDSIIYEDPSSGYNGTGFTFPADAMQFARAKYSANISWLDHMFGKVLNKLAELDDPNNPGKKMSETTIVCFTADHGDMMGEKERISKMVSYEGSARVPFLIRMPGVIAPNQKSDILINHVDMFPTLAGLAGLGEKLDATKLDGRDLSNALLSNKAEMGPKRTFTVAYTSNSNSYPGEIYARTQQYKFTRWSNKKVGNQPAMLLFDMDNDPYETTNLAYHPAFRNIVIEESTACDDFMHKFYPTLAPTVIPAFLQYTLSTSFDANKGTITSSHANGTVTENAIVKLKAEAKPGYKFIGWSGDLTLKTNSVEMVMSGNKTVTANFAIDDNKTRITFETPGSRTWTVPAGTSSVTVEAWGAGGAGGSAYCGVATANTQLRGGGGAGGSFTSTTTSVTSGQVINYTVGAGGIGAASGFAHQSIGQAGGATFADLNSTLIVSAIGGAGGENVSGINIVYGGAGGVAPKTGNTGSVSYYGGNGGTAGAGGTGGGGGSAGAEGDGGHAAIVTAGAAGLSGGAAGGTGTNLTNQLPTNGDNPGGGGAGATVRNNSPFTLNNTHKTGANGGNGKLIIAYELNTGISNVGSDRTNLLSVFPNPANDKITVQCSNSEISQIQLVEITGRVVLTKNVNDKFESIEVSDLKKGIYFLKTFTPIGIYTTKVNLK